MCAIAASTPSTTRAAMIASRYSVYQSSSRAGCTRASTRCTVASPRTSQPASSRSVTIGARCVPAQASSTSSVSAAPQMPVRRILALSAMARAMRRSASRSTYTWQLPSRCPMTGTRASCCTRARAPCRRAARSRRGTRPCRRAGSRRPRDRSSARAGCRRAAAARHPVPRPGTRAGRGSSARSRSRRAGSPRCRTSGTGRPHPRSRWGGSRR